MHLPLKPVPDPIGAGAASRNRRERGGPCLFFLLLLAACQRGPVPLANEVDAATVAADDGAWERLPAGARIRIDGILAGTFEDGARIELGPDFCARAAMSRQEWDRLLAATGAGRRVTVYGNKAHEAVPGPCLVQLTEPGFVAR
jgi:hypothetical protein